MYVINALNKTRKKTCNRQINTTDYNISVMNNNNRFYYNILLITSNVRCVYLTLHVKKKKRRNATTRFFRVIYVITGSLHILRKFFRKYVLRIIVRLS